MNTFSWPTQTPVRPSIRVALISQADQSARMTTSSRLRRYQCKSIWWCRRLRMGYITSCPGPWYVTCTTKHIHQNNFWAFVKPPTTFKHFLKLLWERQKIYFSWCRDAAAPRDQWSLAENLGIQTRVCLAKQQWWHFR